MKIFPSLLFLSLIALFACRTTVNMSSVKLEVLKPAIFALPKNIDTIAIFKRDLYQSDTITFKYTNGDNYEAAIDTSIHTSDLSNKCVDALANFLENEGYFLKVINYSDSLNYLFPKDSMTDYPYLHIKLGADAFIFLDYFKFVDEYSFNESGFTFFMSGIKDKFPEFQSSTRVESIEASLFWDLTFKGDSSIYLYKQPDHLYYGNSVYPELFGNSSKHRLLLNNTAEFMGKSFGTKMVPTWEKADRYYYSSHNDYMLSGEKYLLDNDLLKAAEIYNKQTTNKNKNISAKANYNMALICEMEGNLEAATDWLNRSKSVYKKEDPRHSYHCDQYGKILKKRKEEIELLKRQVR